MKLSPEQMEKLFCTVLDCVDVGIHIVDESGHTVFYNPACARLDGVPAEEALGRHVLEIFPSLTPHTSTLLKVLESGQPILNKQQSFTNFKGKLITTINSTVPVIESGRVVAAVEVSKDLTQVKALSEKVVTLQAALSEKRAGRATTVSEARFHLSDIIGDSPPMQELKNTIRRAAMSTSSVLVFGETGTGKELVAQAIHNEGPRRTGPFIAQNCAALPEALLEGILFGTVKGGFTGAENRPGLFELASGGTLYLDEINSMHRNLQSKLLRVIQDRTVRRVGDTVLRAVDVRFIASTSTEPGIALERGEMRHDLFYRLNVISLRVPPLSERREDIPALIAHFLEKYNARMGLSVARVSPQVLDLFMCYDWPGNVRELEHAIEGAMNIVDGDEIRLEHLPPGIRKGRTTEIRPLREAVEQLEAELIRGALNRTGGNVTEAARMLGIPRQTLQYRLRQMRQPKSGHA